MRRYEAEDGFNQVVTSLQNHVDQVVVFGQQYGHQFTPWLETGHATMFINRIDVAGHYTTGCLSCHTVGWDELADNGGFDDLLATSPWTFPNPTGPGESLIFVWTPSGACRGDIKRLDGVGLKEANETTLRALFDKVKRTGRDFDEVIDYAPTQPYPPAAINVEMEFRRPARRRLPPLVAVR